MAELLLQRTSSSLGPAERLSALSYQFAAYIKLNDLTRVEKVGFVIAREHGPVFSKLGSLPSNLPFLQAEVFFRQGRRDEAFYALEALRMHYDGVGDAVGAVRACIHSAYYYMENKQHQNAALSVKRALMYVLTPPESKSASPSSKGASSAANSRLVSALWSLLGRVYLQ